VDIRLIPKTAYYSFWLFAYDAEYDAEYDVEYDATIPPDLLESNETGHKKAHHAAG